MVFLMEAADPALENFLEAGLDEGRPRFHHERAELLDDRDDPADGILDVLHVLPDLLRLVVVRLDQIQIADDDAEEIVEIVRDALRDGADGRGLA